MASNRKTSPPRAASPARADSPPRAASPARADSPPRAASPAQLDSPGRAASTLRAVSTLRAASTLRAVSTLRAATVLRAASPARVASPLRSLVHSMTQPGFRAEFAASPARTIQKAGIAGVPQGQIDIFAKLAPAELEIVASVLARLRETAPGRKLSL